MPSPNQVGNIVALRALVHHDDEQEILVLDVGDSYLYESSSSAADDGVKVIRPTNVDAGDPGRWLKVMKQAEDVEGTVIADVEGLQDALDGKAPTSHSHAISDVTDLQDSLDAKADVSHVHAISDTTGLQDALDAKANTGDVPTAASDLSNDSDVTGATVKDALNTLLAGGGGGGTGKVAVLAHEFAADASGPFEIDLPVGMVPAAIILNNNINGTLTASMATGTELPLAGKVCRDNNQPFSDYLDYNITDLEDLGKLKGSVVANNLGNPASGQLNVREGPGYAYRPNNSFLDGETFVLNDGVNPAVTFEFDMQRRAAGTITGDLAFLDGETITLDAGQGGGPVVFEFDNNASVAPGNHAVQIEANIEDTIANLRTQIDGNMSYQIRAGSVYGTKVVELLNQNFGTSGNIAITHTVADPGFSVSGMSGGKDYDGVTPGNVVVEITDGFSANSVAQALESAIYGAASLDITPIWNDSQVALNNDAPGTMGNVAITNGSALGFQSVVGMEGGLDAAPISISILAFE
ncbi:MAG: hypothetical protein LLG93_07605 [Deltaproteobacteria bacterium]|nr:hypothetical protein [Deltaproteobacteria bacterium]